MLPLMPFMVKAMVQFGLTTFSAQARKAILRPALILGWEHLSMLIVEIIPKIPGTGVVCASKCNCIVSNTLDDNRTYTVQLVLGYPRSLQATLAADWSNPCQCW